jgi:hypothetical protein
VRFYYLLEIKGARVMAKPKFRKGQKVGVYNPNRARTIYEVDGSRWTGTTWVYTFVNVDTKKPANIRFSSGGFARDEQEERWLSSV